MVVSIFIIYHPAPHPCLKYGETLTWWRDHLVDKELVRNWLDGEWIWEQPWREGLGGVGLWEAWHTPGMCTCSLESQLYHGLHQKKHGQQGEGSDSTPLLPWDPLLEYCIQLWDTQYKKDGITLLDALLLHLLLRVDLLRGEVRTLKGKILALFVAEFGQWRKSVWRKKRWAFILVLFCRIRCKILFNMS